MSDAPRCSSNEDEDILPSGFRRADVVRLMTQCLQDMGYANTAETLQKESGIELLSESIARFRQGILDGSWELVESLVDSLQLGSSASSVRFLIYQGPFLNPPGPVS